MQQVRARRKAWTQRDWDYATAISRRLNAQFRAIRLDIKGRDELHIRALQTEFTALETSRDVKDLGQAVSSRKLPLLRYPPLSPAPAGLLRWY